MKAKLLLAFLLINSAIAFGQRIESAGQNQFGVLYASNSGEKIQGCKYKNIPLQGKVKFVTSFPDFKIQYVNSFPDLKVQFVTSFPDGCGKWQVVESFPDFTVQIVESFPDFKVKIVDNFPGMP